MKLKLNSTIFLAGLLLAIIGAVMEIMGKNTWSWLLWLVVVGGLAVGWLNVTNKESTTVLVVCSTLVIIFGVLIFLPNFGAKINIIAKWLEYMFTPLALVVALKLGFAKVKN